MLSIRINEGVEFSRQTIPDVEPGCHDLVARAPWEDEITIEVRVESPRRQARRHPPLIQVMPLVPPGGTPVDILNAPTRSAILI